MRNPSALTDDILDKLERLLTGYETACENLLYHKFNITETVKDINEVQAAIDYARNGPTWEETCEAFEELDRS